MGRLTYPSGKAGCLGTIILIVSIFTAMAVDNYWIILIAFIIVLLLHAIWDN